MDSRKIVYTETAVVAIGQTVCVLVMLALFALAGSFDASVLLGGILGGVLAILNFFFMAIGASLAADKAEAQDVAGGKKLLQMSMLLRFGLLFAVLAVAAISHYFDLLALVLPLAFTRIILTVSEFFRKKGEKS